MDDIKIQREKILQEERDIKKQRGWFTQAFSFFQKPTIREQAEAIIKRDQHLYTKHKESPKIDRDNYHSSYDKTRFDNNERVINVDIVDRGTLDRGMPDDAIETKLSEKEILQLELKNKIRELTITIEKQLLHEEEKFSCKKQTIMETLKQKDFGLREDDIEDIQELREEYQETVEDIKEELNEGIEELREEYNDSMDELDDKYSEAEEDSDDEDYESTSTYRSRHRSPFNGFNAIKIASAFITFGVGLIVITCLLNTPVPVINNATIGEMFEFSEIFLMTLILIGLIPLVFIFFPNYR